MKTIDEIRRTNLVALVAECGSAAKLAKMMDVSASQLSQWVNGSVNSATGKPRAIGTASCRRAEEATGKSLGWMDVEHDNLAPGFAYKRVAERDDDDPDYVKIKMVKLRLSAGIMGFHAEPDFEDGGTLTLNRNWLAKGGMCADKLIAIRVRGESMEPSLYEDDVVVVNTADREPVDGAVYAVNYEGEAVVKRMSRDIGEWWLTSDNPDQRKYNRKMCRSGECLVVGRVVRKESDRI